MLDAEVVPTANAKNAFFASYRKEGENWVPSVLAYDLDAADQDATVLGEGCYPAATTEGALWAGDVASLDEALSYGTLYRWDGSESTPVFSVSSEGDTWSISGVWASDGYRAVSFSSSDATAGAYIGIWEGDFERCVAWLHAPGAARHRLDERRVDRLGRRVRARQSGDVRVQLCHGVHRVPWLRSRLLSPVDRAGQQRRDRARVRRAERRRVPCGGAWVRRDEAVR